MDNEEEVMEQQINPMPKSIANAINKIMLRLSKPQIGRASCRERV